MSYNANVKVELPEAEMRLLVEAAAEFNRVGSEEVGEEFEFIKVTLMSPQLALVAGDPYDVGEFLTKQVPDQWNGGISVENP